MAHPAITEQSINKIIIARYFMFMSHTQNALIYSNENSSWVEVCISQHRTEKKPV